MHISKTSLEKSHKFLFSKYLDAILIEKICSKYTVLYVHIENT